MLVDRQTRNLIVKEMTDRFQCLKEALNAEEVIEDNKIYWDFDLQLRIRDLRTILDEIAILARRV